MIKFKNSRAFALIMLPLFAPAALASHSEFSEEALFSELPLILTATRLKQPVEQTPASVTLIDRELIDASGALEIAELLRLVPGFQVTRVTGNQTAVGTHGIVDAFPRRLEVQINGRSVYKSAMSSVTWTQLGITLDEVERIEVVRGPNAPAHGSNAFTAVINVITRDPLFDPRYAARVVASPNGYQEGILAFSDQGDKLNYRLSVARNESNGLADISDSASVNLLSYRGIYQIDPEQTLDIQLNYAGGPQDVPVEEVNATNPLRDRDVVAHSIDLKWSRNIDLNEDISLQFYRNFHRENDHYSLGLLSGLVSDAIGAPVSPDVLLLATGISDQEIIHGLFNYQAERYDLELQHRFKPSENTRLVWGAALRQDRLKSYYMLNNRGYIEDFSQRLFANLEWHPWEQTYFNFSGMYEHNETVGTLISPRVAINYLLTDQQTARASVTRGYRTPSLLLANYDYGLHINSGEKIYTLIQTTPNLQPEEITAYELGYLLKLPHYRLDLDLKLYREEMHNLVSIPDNDDYQQVGRLSILGRTGANFVSTQSYAAGNGAELQLRWRPDELTLLSLQYAYANFKARKHTELAPEKYENIDESVPHSTASLLVSHKLTNDWRLSGTAYFLDDIEWLGEGDILPSYTRVDARLARSFRFNGTQGEIALIGTNIFNRNYADYRTPNLIEPAYYLQAKLLY